MIGTESKMASRSSVILLLVLHILAISAKPVINEVTSRQGESLQLPAQRGRSAQFTDGTIIDIPLGYTLERFLLENPDLTSNWIAQNNDKSPVNDGKEENEATNDLGVQESQLSEDLVVQEIIPSDEFVNQENSLLDAVIESNVNAKGNFDHVFDHHNELDNSVGTSDDADTKDREVDFRINNESNIESSPSINPDEIPIADFEDLTEYDDGSFEYDLLSQYQDAHNIYVKPPKNASIPQLIGSENKITEENSPEKVDTSVLDDSTISNLNGFALANSFTSGTDKNNEDYSESISQESDIPKDLETSEIDTFPIDTQNTSPVIQHESSDLQQINFEEQSNNNLFPSGTDQGIPDEVRELFGDIYDDYDYQLPSPPAPLSPEELNQPPSIFFEGDNGLDYDTLQFQNNFPDTESRSNTVDSTVFEQAFTTERPTVLPPTNLIHPVFDFHEGESEPELPDLVPHPGISQFPEFARGKDIDLQPGGVSSTRSYESKGVTQEFPNYVENFNLPIPLEEVNLEEKFSPSFETNEVFTEGLSVEDAIKYIQEKDELEKEKSSSTVSENESSDERIITTDGESSGKKLEQSVQEDLEISSVLHPDNEIINSEKISNEDFNEYVPKLNEASHENLNQIDNDNLDSTDFDDSQGRTSKIASILENETKIHSEGLSIEDAIKYAKLQAERESGKDLSSETEIKLSEKDRVMAHEEIGKLIYKISDESRSISTALPSDSEFYVMLTEAMTKRFLDEFVTVESVSAPITSNSIEQTEVKQEQQIEEGKIDEAPRYEIIPSLVKSYQEGTSDVHEVSSKSEFEKVSDFDENKVQSEGLEIEDAIKYAKQKAQEKLGTHDSSEIKISEHDKNIAFEEMFKVTLNFLSDIEESKQNSPPKITDLELYTKLTDAMTERFIDGSRLEGSASVDSEVKTTSENERKKENIRMAEDIKNLFSQINEYENKKTLNSEKEDFVPEQTLEVVSTTLKNGIENVTASKEQKLIVETPNGRRGYDGQISNSVSQTQNVERYYPENHSSTTSVRDQKVAPQSVGHDISVSQTETIERIHPEKAEAQTPSVRDFKSAATPITYQPNGYATQYQQQEHVIGAPFTLIQVPQAVEHPKGFFRTLAETGSVIEAGAAAFRKKVDIFKRIFKKGSSNDYETEDIHLAVVPAYVSQVEQNAHPVEVIDYPRSSLSTSVDSSVSTSVNYQKLDAPPKGLQRINEDEFKKSSFDTKSYVMEKAAPLLSNKLSPPPQSAGPDFDIRSHHEVADSSQFVELSHGSQVHGGQEHYSPVQVHSQTPEHHAGEDYTGRSSDGEGSKSSHLHDTVNGVYHSVRDSYDNVRNAMSRVTSFFTPSYFASQDELSTEQVVTPLQVQHQQPLHYQPVYLAVQQQEEEEDHKAGFLGKLKKKLIPWL